MTSITGSATTTIQKLTELAAIDEPHEIGKTSFLFSKASKGWLTIEDKKDSWFVYTSSHRTTNDFGLYDSFGVNVDKQTGDLKPNPESLTGAWECAVGLLPVDNKHRAKEIHDFMGNWINSAYDFRIKQDGPAAKAV